MLSEAHEAEMNLGANDLTEDDLDVDANRQRRHGSMNIFEAYYDLQLKALQDVKKDLEEEERKICSLKKKYECLKNQLKQICLKHGNFIDELENGYLSEICNDLSESEESSQRILKDTEEESDIDCWRDSMDKRLEQLSHNANIEEPKSKMELPVARCFSGQSGTCSVSNSRCILTDPGFVSDQSVLIPPPSETLKREREKKRDFETGDDCNEIAADLDETTSTSSSQSPFLSKKYDSSEIEGIFSKSKKERIGFNPAVSDGIKSQKFHHGGRVRELVAAIMRLESEGIVKVWQVSEEKARSLKMYLPFSKMKVQNIGAFYKEINSVFGKPSRKSGSRAYNSICENARQAFRYASFLPYKPMEDQKINPWNGDLYRYYESFRKKKLDKAKINSLRSKARQKEMH
eukprot:763895-Hanusia_phi.AAC.3